MKESSPERERPIEIEIRTHATSPATYEASQRFHPTESQDGQSMEEALGKFVVRHPELFRLEDRGFKGSVEELLGHIVASYPDQFGVSVTYIDDN